jgi:glycosyltransferase involved in cell wall biosynthesis
MHDLGPLVAPAEFPTVYRVVAARLARSLSRHAAMVGTPSRRAAVDIARILHVPADRTVLLPPGVGEPFLSWPIDDLSTRARRWCVLVGAHDERKNPQFLVDLWPEVHRRTGLELHLTKRATATTRRSVAVAPVAGVVTHVDPTDDELAGLYAGALCLLWPSRFEGYGLPLLESMAVGTPFLSTDSGAAAELAVEPAEQIVALDAAVWIERIVTWADGAAARLCQPSYERARVQTWDATADAIADALEQVAARSA